VDLASAGLQERGIGEEIFLDPLYARIKKHANPANEIRKLIDNGISLEKIIKDYGNLNMVV
jgi:hypothetical protein